MVTKELKAAMQLLQAPSLFRTETARSLPETEETAVREASATERFSIRELAETVETEAQAVSA
jgi:hypothetical protein